jgi:O-antigen/teichoic acid export membrane protein
MAWSIFAYFSLFDFGLGRALTQLAAERIGTINNFEVGPLMWTALSLMTGMGVLGGVIAALTSPFLIHRVFQVPPQLQMESIHACWFLCISLPFVVATSGLTAMLGAVQRFDVLNWLRMPQGILTFLGPWVASLITPRLPLAMIVLLASRIVFFLLYLALCIRVIPDLAKGFRTQLCYVRSLLKFGGWVTVTNVIGPAMMYFDRFLIGAWVSVAAVSYYATPHEAVNRFLLVPVSISAALFPAVSGMLDRNADAAMNLFARAVDLTASVLFPAIAITVMFANDGLGLWLGTDFAAHGYRVLQFLAIGAFINGLAQIAFTVVQGAGRADITAKFHLAEFPIYMATLWYLVIAMGVVGAALAWVLRAMLDMILLFIALGRLTRESHIVWAKFFEGLGLTVLLVGCIFVAHFGYWRILALTGLIFVYLSYGWRIVLRNMRPADFRLYMRMLWSSKS